MQLKFDPSSLALLFSSWLSDDRGSDPVPEIEQPILEVPPSGADRAIPAHDPASEQQVHKSDEPTKPEPAATRLFLPDFPEVSTTTTSTAVDTSRAVGSTNEVLSSTAIIVPPLNFNMVSKGIYRSGHPNERNFEFLNRLNLKSIMYLANEDYRSNMVDWATSRGINIFHFRLAINKEPMAEMDEHDVSKALQVILQRKNWPILIHCNKGKYRVGCMVGLLRRLQGWSHTSIFEEYSRFAGTKISDLEYIEVFDLQQVSLAHRG